jgi:hypothetical protein
VVFGGGLHEPENRGVCGVCGVCGVWCADSVSRLPIRVVEKVRRGVFEMRHYLPARMAHRERHPSRLTMRKWDGSPAEDITQG